MPALIVDASVAVKWILPEPDRDLALALLAASNTLIAPGLLLLEAANVFWLRTKQGLLTAEEARRGLQLLEAALVIEPDDPALAHRALEIALTLDHPAYDGFYLALAERHGAMLVSEDRRLRAKLAGTGWQPIVLGMAEIAGRA